MTKKEFVTEVAEHSSIDAKDVDKVLESMIFVLKEALITEEKVRLSKLGIFSTQVKPARVIKNQLTKEELEIPQKRVIKYKPSKYLRDQVDMKA
ncbi:HU family DNA-binding protein [Mycoplasma sp. NEAQ87857]|uniref:HU family DNA-binding protein n=1 Tax=Mycoplasma sp. NEAQ87857 TaxID=2683967 RepID=UPI001317D709|nr:HU family DNA-binding protein [Mycoplasma sp. NEAQ87857]QGZ97748.1 HU family DNA-binding protein [Mycoplasma sp. NEAQ87857]